MTKTTMIITKDILEHLQTRFENLTTHLEKQQIDRALHCLHQCIEKLPDDYLEYEEMY